MTDGDIAVKVRIRGRVQGVFFRAWTEEQAEELGIRGWVRNRRDGSVEALFQGAEPVVRHMIERCREGPSQARVERIDEEVVGGEAVPGFRSLPTA